MDNLLQSTAPRGLGSLTWLSIKKSSERFYVKPMKNSPKISDGKSGNIVLCPDQGKTQCPGSGDHICLIRAGDISFEAKALNCQKGGGMAALVYNDEDAGFSGAISQDTEVKIPILSMSGRSGKLIVDEYLNNSGRFGSDDGYISLDGTSMAAPHVTGAIAAIWRGCGNCKNTQVLSCLQTTALDLGAPGKDDYYGYGLIQTSSAYDCLKSVCC
jgi:serine protease